MDSGKREHRMDVVRKYFERMDAGSETILELVAADAEIGFPKFGVGRGKDAFHKLWSGFADIAGISHTLDNIVVDGDLVVVEGRSDGRGVDGRAWSAGSTAGGRFCNVFQFKGDLISRVYVYLDPDYFGDDEPRFRWGRDVSAW